MAGTLALGTASQPVQPGSQAPDLVHQPGCKREGGPYRPFLWDITLGLASDTPRRRPLKYSLSKPDDALGGRNASLVCIKHAALTNFLTARRHRAHPPSDYDGILALSAGSDYAQLCA